MDDKMNKKHHEEHEDMEKTHMDKTHKESVKKDTTDKKMPGKGVEHDQKKAGKDECCDCSDCGTSSKDTGKKRDK